MKHSFYRPHARVTFDNDLVNPVTGEVTYPVSMTKQEFKAECDINNIIKQFSATGMIRHVSANAAQGRYEDLPDPMDFQESLAAIKLAEESFMSLPSKLRDRFHNEPAEFLAFVSDPANLDEMRSLGLATTPRPVPQEPPTSTTGGDGGTPPSGGAKAP